MRFLLIPSHPGLFLRGLLGRSQVRDRPRCPSPLETHLLTAEVLSPQPLPLLPILVPPRPQLLSHLVSLLSTAFRVLVPRRPLGFLRPLILTGNLALCLALLLLLTALASSLDRYLFQLLLLNPSSRWGGVFSADCRTCQDPTGKDQVQLLPHPVPRLPHLLLLPCLTPLFHSVPRIRLRDLLRYHRELGIKLRPSPRYHLVSSLLILRFLLLFLRGVMACLMTPNSMITPLDRYSQSICPIQLMLIHHPRGHRSLKT